MGVPPMNIRSRRGQCEGPKREALYLGTHAHDTHGRDGRVTHGRDAHATQSKTTASFVHASLAAIKDQVLPENSGDASEQQLDFWPHKGTTEWIQFEWPEKHELSGIKIYWFDDTGRGQCHLPKSWRVLYRTTDGKFEPVKDAGPYGIEKDTFNKVNFAPVTTDAIKVEITLQDRWSAGVQEIVIE